MIQLKMKMLNLALFLLIMFVQYVVLAKINLRKHKESAAASLKREGQECPKRYVRSRNTKTVVWSYVQRLRSFSAENAKVWHTIKKNYVSRRSFNLFSVLCALKEIEALTKKEI